ncbi:hypothetical protein MNBD_BACTEROID05-957, partial [hydrothermal vent metagenome]
MNKRMLNVLLVVGISLFLAESSLAAQTQNQGASFLVEMGSQYLAEGNRQDAISEFSKALLIEPGNPEALEQLSLLGFDGGIYDGAQTQGSRMAELSSSRGMYQDQANQLEKEKMALQIKFDQLQNKHQSLLDEHVSQKEELLESEE